MDRKRFFDHISTHGSELFPQGLNASQSKGLNTKLDVWAKWYADNHPVSYLAAALGQIYHETGSHMQPVLECFAQTREESAQKLETAFQEGRLKWVKTPYWQVDETGNHPVGGGDIQITHRRNYVAAEKKLAQKFGVNIQLSKNYDLALDPIISAHIAFSGMIDGWFRPCKLSDFETDEGFDYKAARDIVNGDTELIGDKISKYCKLFEDALIDAGADKKFGEPTRKIDWPI